MNFPENYNEGTWNWDRFYKVIADREKCIDWAQRSGLLPVSKRCYTHKIDMKVYKTPTTPDQHKCVGLYFKCIKEPHTKSPAQVSMAKNTWFEDRTLPIEDMLFLIFSFAKGLTYQGAIEERIRPDNTQLSSGTVASIYEDCRQIAVARLAEVASERIGGNRNIVQVGSLKFGRWKHHRGRFVAPTTIFAALEVSTGEQRLKVCNDEKKKDSEMLEFLNLYIKKDSIVVSENQKICEEVELAGFEDYQIVEVGEFINGSGHTINNLKGSWSNLRQKLGCGNIKPCLDEHLCVYLWRKWCVKQNINPFCDLINGLKALYPI